MTNANTQLQQVLAESRTILSQCVIAANEASMAAAAVAAANPAPLNSPNFTGIPTAPTAAPGTNSSQLATTQYLDRLLGAALGIPTLDNTGHIPVAQLPSAALGGVSYQGVWNASTNSPTLASGTGVTGDFYLVGVAGTTTLDGISSWAVGDQVIFGASTWQKVPVGMFVSTNFPLTGLAVQAAHTFVANATSGSASPTAVSETAATAMLNAMVGDSGSGGTKGLVPAPAAGDYAAGKYLDAGGFYSVPPVQDLSAYALLLSPAFTGTPTAATQAQDTNSTALATCEFVLSQLSVINPLIDGTAAAGTSLRGSREDHVHPTDTTRAPLASPTLTGTPAAPTPGTNVNTTQIPTAAWVNTWFPTKVTLTATYAPLASPTFTGDPKAPTQSPGDNSTNLATTAYADAAAVAAGPAAGAGITVSGATVSLDTNNSLGVSAVCMFQNNSGGNVANGATVAGSSLLTLILTIGGTDGNDMIVGTGSSVTGTWRNIMGIVLSVGQIGLFQRTA